MDREFEMSDKRDEQGRDAVARQLAECMAAMETKKAEARERGTPALWRLLPIAQADTGQSAVVRRFLLGLYDGGRFPFVLADLRRLDDALVDDCLAVLAMDAWATVDICERIQDGQKIFRELAGE
jgi:hypothetical protein